MSMAYLLTDETSDGSNSLLSLRVQGCKRVGTRCCLNWLSEFRKPQQQGVLLIVSMTAATTEPEQGTERERWLHERTGANETGGPGAEERASKEPPETRVAAGGARKNKELEDPKTGIKPQPPSEESYRYNDGS